MSYVLHLLLATGLWVALPKHYASESVCIIAADLTMRRAQILAALHPETTWPVLAARCVLKIEG